MICSNCGTENEAGRKFCDACGTSLALGCPNCGADNRASARFCADCGQSLSSGYASAAPSRRAGASPRELLRHPWLAARFTSAENGGVAAPCGRHDNWTCLAQAPALGATAFRRPGLPS
ncbi:MAG: zinc ribbon domain-containing protein [Chloroflexi bacterium]|nr:zinc ribbon domain-containing protein [Chloroflexota bacterium]